MGKLSSGCNISKRICNKDPGGEVGSKKMVM